MVDRTGLHTAPVPGATPLGTAPIDGRLVQGALFGTAGQCLAGGGYTASATTMAFAIAAGVYQIPDTANAGAVYHSPIDAATLTPAAGQAGGRIDSIYVLQQDFEKNGTTSRVVYGLAAGTPGSGTAPSLSGIAGGPMRLMNITVPATATKATDCTVNWVVPPATVATDGVVAGSKTLLDLIPGAYVGQIGFAGGVDYRWNGSAWKVWNWPAIPFDTYAAAENGASPDSNGGLMEASIGAGILTLNFNLYKAAGMGLDSSYLRMKPGFLPSGHINCNGYTEAGGGGARGVAAFLLDNTGGLVLKYNGGVNVVTIRGSAQYRVAA